MHVLSLQQLLAPVDHCEPLPVCDVAHNDLHNAHWLASSLDSRSIKVGKPVPSRFKRNQLLAIKRSAKSRNTVECVIPQSEASTPCL